MASRKEYELLFQIRGQLGSNFNSTFNSANNAMKNMQNTLTSIKRVQGDISAYTKYKQAIEQNKNKITSYNTELTKLEQKYKSGEITQKQYTSGVQKQKNNIANVNAKIKEEESRLSGLETKLKSVGVSTDNLESDNNALAASYQRIKTAQENVAKYNNIISQSNAKVSALKGTLTSTIAVGVTLGAALYKGAIEPTTEFYEQMSAVEAISGATNKELEQLTATAKRTGLETKFTSTEAAKAYEYMGMAGWKTNQMLSGLPGIINLTAASGEDLAEVSDIVTDALTAFDLKADDSVHFADVLAAAATNSNTNVSMMGESFKMAAPLAGALKYSIEDVATALGLMANSGIKSSMAGTSMRSWLTRLAKPTKESQTAMDDLGLSLTDSNGNMKTFAQVISETREAFKGLTESQKTAYAAMIAGKPGMSGLLAVVNSSNEDFNKLTNSINNADGAAERMAKIRLDNLAGDIELMQSAAESASLTLGESFQPEIRETVQDITELIETGTDWLTKNKETVKTVSEVAMGLVGLKLGTTAVSLVYNKTVGVVAKVAKGFSQLKAASDVLKMAKVAKEAGTATSTLSGLSKALGLTGGSLSLVTGGALTAVVALAAIGTAIYKANKAAKEADLASRFGDVTLSIDEMQTAAEQLVGGKILENVSKSLEAFEGLESYAQSIDEARSAIEKFDWKIDLGVNLSETDVSEYQTAIDTYVSSLQTYITEKNYALTLGVQAVLDDNSESYSQILSSISSVEGVLQPKLAELGNKLKEHISSAFDDGKLVDINEQQAASEVLASIAEIENIVTQSQTQAKMDALALEYGGNLTPETFKEYQEKLNEVAEESSKKVREGVENSLAGLNANYLVAKQNYEEDGSQVNLDAMNEAKAAYENFKSEMASGEFEQKLAEPYAKATEYAINTVKEVYPEFKEGLNTLYQGIGSEFAANGQTYDDLTKQQKNYYNVMSADAYIAWHDVSGTTRSNVSDIISSLDDNIIKIEEYITKCQEMGKKVPAEYTKILRAYRGFYTLQYGTPENVEGYLNTFPQTNTKPTGNVKKHALGSYYTDDTFIAGESGAELITGARGSRVFTAAETANIMKNIKAAKYVTAVMPSLVQGTPSTPMVNSAGNVIDNSSKPSIVVQIENKPTIYVDGADKNDVDNKLSAVNVDLTERIRQVLVDISIDEKRGSYD